MSDPAPEAAPAKAGNPMVPMVIALVALLVGAGLGLKVVGPMVKGPADAAAESSGGGGHGEEAPATMIVRVDNLIVNPAGSMGSRYLIMSVAFEVPDQATQDKLTRADVPLRDAITGVLEQETLESLGRVGAREAFKGVLATLAGRFVPGAKVVVYIPQFLIQ